MNPNNSGIGPATPTAGNSEERINVHGTPPAVTRVSRRAVLLVGVFGASLGLVVLMLGFGDHNPPRKDGPADETQSGHRDRLSRSRICRRTIRLM